MNVCRVLTARVGLVFILLALSTAGVPAAAMAQLRTTLVASGLNQPVAYVPHPTDPAAALVVEQAGRVRVVRNGQLQSADFLDLRNQIAAGGEQGLLGLAFAPDFATSGRVFVNFTNRSGHTVVARFTRVAGDPVRADPDSRFDLMWPNGDRFITQPFSNHNGGHLAFGPDGFLYIGLGDGGSGNDPMHLAQNPLSLLGKMLRIDVSVATADPRGYVVPANNPFVGRPGVLPEIWAFGLRNPWRYSFDDPRRGGTGGFFIGDVGQGAFEEISYGPAGAGGRNYGWRNREGAHDNVTSLPPFSTPLVDPIWEYGRALGTTVTGGYIYRGTALGSAFVGRYFFADFGSNRVWSVAISAASSMGEVTASNLVEHTADLGAAAASPASFGVDASGELYVVNYGGTVYRIDGAPGVDPAPPPTGTTPGRPYTGPPVGTAKPRN